MRLDDMTFNAVADELRPFLVRFAAACLYNWADAEDVVQDTIAALWQHVHTTGGVEIDQPWLWFRQATLNQIVSLKRRRKTRPDIAKRIDLSPHRWDAIRATGDFDPAIITGMEQALAKLPPAIQRAVLMRLDGYSWREIAPSNYHWTQRATEKGARKTLRIVPKGTTRKPQKRGKKVKSLD